MFTEKTAILNKRAGTGGGHAAFQQVAEANMERQRWYLDRQVGRFVVAEDGTWVERQKAQAGNWVYKQEGNGQLRLFAYHCIRELTNGSVNYIHGSGPKLDQFPGAAVSFHSMVARPHDYVVLSDHRIERPKSKDTVVLVPTEDMVKPLQEKGYKVKNAGWFVHPWMKDETAYDECVRKLQKREHITALVALTGQTPKDHCELIMSDVKRMAHLARDENRVRFIFYTATNGEFGQVLAEELEKERLDVCVNSQIFMTGAHAMVLWGEDFYKGNDRFWWAFHQSQVVFRMPCEYTAGAALRPMIDLPAKNGNAQGNADYLRDNGFSVPADALLCMGITGILRNYLDCDHGRTLLENMERARSKMNLNGGENLVAMLAEDPRVRHQLAQYWS